MLLIMKSLIVFGILLFNGLLIILLMIKLLVWMVVEESVEMIFVDSKVNDVFMLFFFCSFYYF